MDRIQNKKRLIIYISCLALFLILILIRFVYLMVYLPTRETAAAPGKPEVERGPILDRNGKILAIQTKLHSVSASIPEIDDLQATATSLAAVLGMDVTEITGKLQRQAEFAWIKRKISDTEATEIMELIKQEKLKGIHLELESARSYPKQNLASHIVGIAGIDNTGLEGIEAAFDEVLLPQVADSGVDKVYGNQVFLTIDINVQFVIQSIAEKAFRENRADAVMILVMEAKSGKLLGSCSIPDFNPNNYNQYPESARIDKPVVAAYEPGSVFKVFSIASFLELGAITEADTFQCNGVYDRVSNPINCLAVHGLVDARKILMLSCNVGAAFASEGVDAESFYNLLQSFGFGKPTGIPLPWESAGILREPSQWSGRSKPTIAFGQEISVSAMQIMAAATVLTNQGVLLKPLIVDKIISPNGKLLRQFNREPVRQVISPAVAGRMLLMMETATAPGGTASRAAIDGMRISAKTGTGQVMDAALGGYSDNHHMASFLGIFPTEDPQLIIYVVIDYPRGEYYYGSRIAAPVFKETAESLLKLLNLPGTAGAVITHSGQLTLSKPPALEIGELMPDLHGTPKRLLLPLFQQEILSIVIRGNGYVVRQQPPPGTPLGPDTKIILELE